MEVRIWRVLKEPEYQLPLAIEENLHGKDEELPNVLQVRTRVKLGGKQAILAEIVEAHRQHRGLV